MKPKKNDLSVEDLSAKLEANLLGIFTAINNIDDRLTALEKKLQKKPKKYFNTQWTKDDIETK